MRREDVSMMLAAPLDYFTHSAGPATRPTLWLDWGFAAISVAVCIIIAGLLIWAIARRRDFGPDVARRGHSGLNWITIGAGISTFVLLLMAIAAFVGLRQVTDPPRPAQLVITVTGYDWWWKVEYQGPNGGFETANEIHIPTGVPVRLKLKSADVIHAFWVPALAGKTQMIPGVLNTQWLQADKPGVYYGQCTQFCGLQHAHMAFEIIADTPADFARWRQAQTQPAIATGDGEAIFLDQCGGCHAVHGTTATGGHGPDLTHLMSRRHIAAGLLPTTPDNVMAWVAHPQTLKPGARMPDFALASGDATALRAYLMELR